MASVTSCVFSLYMQGGCTAEGWLCTETSFCDGRTSSLLTFGVVHLERFEGLSWKFRVTWVWLERSVLWAVSASLPPAGDVTLLVKVQSTRNIDVFLVFHLRSPLCLHNIRVRGRWISTKVSFTLVTVLWSKWKWSRLRPLHTQRRNAVLPSS